MKDEAIFVALGANLGDTVATLREAVRSMHAWPNTQVVATSRLWRTAPVNADGPDFTNAAVQLRSDFEPEPLLQALLALEAALGRQRNASACSTHGPPHDVMRTHSARLIDLDLLMHGSRVLSTPHLTLPHPRMHLRAFVLAPLADIAPDLVLHDGRSVRDTLNVLRGAMQNPPQVIQT